MSRIFRSNFEVRGLRGRATWAVRIAQGGLPRPVVEKAVLAAVREARHGIRQRGAKGRRWTLRWKIVRGGLQRWRNGRAELLAARCGVCGVAFLRLPASTPGDARRSDMLAHAVPPISYLAVWMPARGGDSVDGAEGLCRGCLAVRFHLAIRVGPSAGEGVPSRRRKRAA